MPPLPRDGMIEPCYLCAGACCETVSVPLHMFPRSPGVARWLSLRGELRGGMVRFAAPCCELGEDGACGIYDSRPQPCRDYQPGSPACRSAVIALRSTQAATILASLDRWESSNSRGTPPPNNSLLSESSDGEPRQ